jgi:hypothetical protein
MKAVGLHLAFIKVFLGFGGSIPSDKAEKFAEFRERFRKR